MDQERGHERARVDTYGSRRRGLTRGARWRCKQCPEQRRLGQDIAARNSSSPYVTGNTRDGVV